LPPGMGLFMTSVRQLGFALFLIAAPAWAQTPHAEKTPQPVVVPETAAPEAVVPVVEEERPDFQPLRPADGEDKSPANAADPVPAPPPPPAVAAPAAVAPPVLPVAPPPSVAPPPPVEKVAVITEGASVPWWGAVIGMVLGAILAMSGGSLTLRAMRRGEQAERRRAVAASLATELDTRRLAFESVPLPPNVDAGVSFVSSVVSMAGIDCAFRAAQGQFFLFTPQLAANISVHYAAVQRVADFVKGQSMAAAVRMLQANRLGGHPCPDAGAMREAHVELAAAFRGLDKVILSLRAQAR